MPVKCLIIVRFSKLKLPQKAGTLLNTSRLGSVSHLDAKYPTISQVVMLNVVLNIKCFMILLQEFQTWLKCGAAELEVPVIWDEPFPLSKYFVTSSKEISYPGFNTIECI